MYENGGNTIHRMFDGHPELFVYPFESQLGTRFSSHFIQSLVPFRYCWPEFPLHGNLQDDYELFYDEELKTFLRVRGRSKFKGADLQIDEDERKKIFLEVMDGKDRNRANLIEAFFVATFKSWKNYNLSGKERAYVGYSPVIGLDAEKIFADLPNAHLVHIVRNPYSAYADTKKRPFPLSLKKYIWTWNIVQHMALTFQQMFPKNFHIVRYEDLIEDSKASFSNLCEKVGISFSQNLLFPSWNGKRLEQVYPWGTIRIPTPQANIDTLNELSVKEKTEIRTTSIVMLKQLGYEHLC